MDDSVQIAHNANLDPGTSSFSLDAWVKTSKATGFQVVVSKYECGQTCISFVSNSYYFLCVNDGKPTADLRDTDGAFQILTGTASIADNNFHHLAMVRDMAAAELRLYVDGVLNASAPLTASGAIKDDDGEPDPFLIGAFIQGGTTTRAGFFSGLIDEVEFFNRALTAAEVQAIFQAGSAGKCKPPATLTLAPAAATNPVGTEHCVTATVRDALENPSPNITVRVTVAGSFNGGGSGTTNADGQTLFCYPGPALLPGGDTISAFADMDNDSTQDDNEPAGAAAKTWVIPATTAGRVTGGGQIASVVFSVSVQTTDNGLKGTCTIVDKAADVRVKCLDVTSLSVSGPR